MPSTFRGTRSSVFQNLRPGDNVFPWRARSAHWSWHYVMVVHISSGAGIQNKAMVQSIAQLLNWHLSLKADDFFQSSLLYFPCLCVREFLTSLDWFLFLTPLELVRVELFALQSLNRDKAVQVLVSSIIILKYFMSLKSRRNCLTEMSPADKQNNIAVKAEERQKYGGRGARPNHEEVHKASSFNCQCWPLSFSYGELQAVLQTYNKVPVFP